LANLYRNISYITILPRQDRAGIDQHKRIRKRGPMRAIPITDSSPRGHFSALQISVQEGKTIS
jgi:hypothetical protein